MNLFRTLAQRVLHFTKSMLLLIGYILTWPKVKMPANVASVLTKFHPTMSIYYASFSIIGKYELHSKILYWKLKKFILPFGIKITKIDILILKEVQHSLLAAVVHFIAFLLFYIWYSPNTSQI